MEILGERWTFVVLREVFNGVRRFDDMRRHAAIPRQVLTDRLALLVDHDILRKEPYQEPGQRVRHEYRLTAEGLRPLPGAGRDRASGATATSPTRRAPPVEFAHRDCGAPVDVRHALRRGPRHHREPRRRHPARAGRDRRSD